MIIILSNLNFEVSYHWRHFFPDLFHHSSTVFSYLQVCIVLGCARIGSFKF